MRKKKWGKKEYVKLEKNILLNTPPPPFIVDSESKKVEELIMALTITNFTLSTFD